MKNGEFDLKGKAIDCSGLPTMGDAGKEIFRALKVACNGFEDSGYADFKTIGGCNQYLIIDKIDSIKMFCDGPSVKYIGFKIIQPSDVLGQAAINAAMDGATIVFEGDKIHWHQKIKMFFSDGSTCVGFYGAKNVGVIAYKLLEEKPRHRVPSIESRVLSEKMGFKELCPVCSPKEWQEREAETFDDLRDAYLSVAMANEAKDKENELLKQRIKDMHSALNDIESMADKIKVSTNV